jgi:hypothetical protein
MTRHAFHEHDDQARHGGGEKHGHDDGGSVQFNQFDLTNYLHAEDQPDGTFAVRHFLRVEGFELNGEHVAVSGLGSDFGMYFLIDASGTSGPAGRMFDKLDIALMVDPHNNDGALSATATGVGFANGTGGDYALATGHLVSATMSVDPATNNRQTEYVERITPTGAGKDVFGRSLAAGDLLQELLTTASSSVLAGPGFTAVNGGAGVAQLVSGNILRLSLGDVTHDRGDWGCGGHSA